MQAFDWWQRGLMRLLTTVFTVPAFLASASCSAGSMWEAQSAVLHTVIVNGIRMRFGRSVHRIPVGAILLIHGRTWSGIPEPTEGNVW